MKGRANSRRDLPVIWHLWFVFIRLLFAPFALPILFSLFIGRPNCMSWNEISGEEKSDEEWEVEIERDRVEREWKQRNFIHDFPRVPEVKYFGQCSYERRDHRLAAWNLADKVAQSCVHYEIRGAEGYGEWKKWNAGQTRRSIVTPTYLPWTHRRVFSCSVIKLLPTRDNRMMTEFQSLNAISISSNYICRNWLNNNKRKFYVRCNLLSEIDRVDWN